MVEQGSINPNQHESNDTLVLADIQWSNLQPQESHFVIGLLDYLHDEKKFGKKKQAKKRVFAARDKLPIIAELAENVKDWNVFGEYGFDSFIKGLWNQRDNIGHGRRNDDLLQASYGVMICEGRFYGIL